MPLDKVRDLGILTQSTMNWAGMLMLGTSSVAIFTSFSSCAAYESHLQWMLVTLRGWSNVTHTKFNKTAGRRLEKSIWRYNSAVRWPISTKFGTPVQNAMPMTMNKSKSEPEVEFLHGRHPFSETRSGNNSDAVWDISSKFGLTLTRSYPAAYTVTAFCTACQRKSGVSAANTQNVISSAADGSKRCCSSGRRYAGKFQHHASSS